MRCSSDTAVDREKAESAADEPDCAPGTIVVDWYSDWEKNFGNISGKSCTSGFDPLSEAPKDEMCESCDGTYDSNGMFFKREVMRESRRKLEKIFGGRGWREAESNSKRRKVSYKNYVSL